MQTHNCHWRYDKQLSVYYKNAWTLINFLFLYSINESVFCVVAVGHCFIQQDKSCFLRYLSRFIVKKIHVECHLAVTDLSPGTAFWQKQRDWEYILFVNTVPQCMKSGFRRGINEILSSLDL